MKKFYFKKFIIQLCSYVTFHIVIRTRKFNNITLIITKIIKLIGREGICLLSFNYLF